MKAFIQKIFSYLKALFIRLRVVLTLQFGRDEVDDNEKESEEESDSHEQEVSNNDS